MAGRNRPARLNRVLIAVIGLVVLLVGLAAGAAGLGRLPVISPDGPLFTAPGSTPGWLPWVAAIAAIVIGLLCLRWLLAQTLHRPRTGTWTLPTVEQVTAARGATRLAASTATDALVADIETYAGVHDASAWLVGDHRRPSLSIEVTVTADAELAELRRRIDEHAVPRLATALDLDTLPTDLLLRVHDASTPRVA